MPEPAQPLPSLPRPAKPAKPCIHCAYDLSATPADSNCPECGLSVWTSVEGHRLQNFSTPSLRRLRLGLRVLRIGLIAMIIGATWGQATRHSLLTPSIENGVWVMPDPWDAIGWLYVPTSLIYAVIVLGVCMSSRPLSLAPATGSSHHESAPIPGRATLRWGAVGLAIGMLLHVGFGVRGLFRDQPMGVGPLTTWDLIEHGSLWAASLIYSASVATMLAGGSSYFRRIAEGIPSAGLAWFSRWTGRTLAVMVLAVYTLGVTASVAGWLGVASLLESAWWFTEMAVGFSLLALLAAFAKRVRSEIESRPREPFDQALAPVGAASVATERAVETSP